jgi:hypothetical protein
MELLLLSSTTRYNRAGAGAFITPGKLFGAAPCRETQEGHPTMTCQSVVGSSLPLTGRHLIPIKQRNVAYLTAVRQASHHVQSAPSLYYRH